MSFAFMVISYTNFGNYSDDWDDEPIHRPASDRPAANAAPGGLSTSSPVSIVVDSALLPVRMEFSYRWKNEVPVNRVGTELMNAYLTGVNERCARLVGDPGQPPQHDGVVSARQRYAALLETRTWDEYTRLRNGTLGLGTYQVSGPTEVDDEPVMTVKGNRLNIVSFQVWLGWAGCAEPWMLESETLACVQKIRDLRPSLATAHDYSGYSDDELESMDDQHRRRLIDNRGI
ncbi:hypothetical protein ACWDOP_11175 [Nocardia sp. NPDC003693]